MAKQLLTSYPNEEWTAILTQKVSFWQIESNTLVKPKNPFIIQLEPFGLAQTSTDLHLQPTI